MNERQWRRSRWAGYLPLFALTGWQACAWTEWGNREVAWAYAVGDQAAHLSGAYAIQSGHRDRERWSPHGGDGGP